MHNKNWDDLRVALAVAEAGSVNSAAQLLGVNHATVLRRIAAFEERHEVTVFRKSAKGYQVEPGALQIIDAIRAVDRAVDGFERTLRSREKGLTGSIRITTTDSLCRAILPSLLTNLHRKHPSLTVDIASTNARLNLSKLDAEITIRPALELPPGLTGAHVATMGFAVFATQAIADDWCHAPWLGVDRHLARSPVATWMTDHVDGSRIISHADSFVTMTELAASGLGLAMLPCCLGDLQPELVRVAGLPHKLTTRLWVASHGDLARTPRIAMIMQDIAEALAPLADALEGH